MARILGVTGLLFLLACSQGVGTTGGPSSSDIYVNSSIGFDTNPGTFEKPLKTIKHAITVWTPGRTVVLIAGTYDAASGEGWEYSLPDGIAIKANTSGVILENDGTKAAFNVPRQARLEYLHLKGFKIGVRSEAGEPALIGTSFEANITAVRLSGITKATLESVRIDGGRDGLELFDSARAAISGGRITGMTGQVAYLQGSSSLEVFEGTIEDNKGGIVLRENSSFTGRKCSIRNSARIGVEEASKLALDDCWIWGSTESALYSSSTDASISLIKGGVQRSTGRGLEVRATTTISGTYITGNGGGIYCQCKLTIENAWVAQNQGYGVQFFGSEFKARGTQFVSNRVGISAGVGAIDLGRASDVGGNDLSGNSETGLEIGTTTSKSVFAYGNVWQALVQGAGANGKYSPSVVSGPQSGQNFKVPAGTTIQL